MREIEQQQPSPMLSVPREVDWSTGTGGHSKGCILSEGRNKSEGTVTVVKYLFVCLLYAW